MRMTCRSTGWLLWDRKFIGSLCLLLLISASLEAAESPKLFGVATERWYVQKLPDGGIAQDPDGRIWDYGLYLDIGYNLNFNNPGNDLWRSKSTTFKVNQPQVNMAMGFVRKEATPQSRWGIEFGLQAGVDTQDLVPEPPPASNEAISNADSLRHLYRANGSYLLPLGDGLEVTAGLINSYIGYESYWRCKTSITRVAIFWILCLIFYSVSKGPIL